MTDLVFKIAPAALWREAMEKGSFSGSPIDAKDGFIHFSTRDQVRETAEKHFAGVADLVLVAVAITGLELRWEPSRGGVLFPHLYDELPLTAVRWVRPLPLGADGAHEFPDLSGSPTP